MATQPTDYHGMAKGVNAAFAYSHVQNTEQAKRSGVVTTNTEGIKRPSVFVLAVFERPERKDWFSARWVRP